MSGHDNSTNASVDDAFLTLAWSRGGVAALIPERCDPVKFDQGMIIFASRQLTSSEHIKKQSATIPGKS
ncbi:hypothetical protein BD309DRAFT_1021320 [Dichomitus squalens]|nr:hypothetical protein BD309DRAFT_1021320 [Dichomitus squalens]